VPTLTPGYGIEGEYHVGSKVAWVTCSIAKLLQGATSTHPQSSLYNRFIRCCKFWLLLFQSSICLVCFGDFCKKAFTLGLMNQMDIKNLINKEFWNWVLNLYTRGWLPNLGNHENAYMAHFFVNLDAKILGLASKFGLA
jgi:hypothetical protein